MQPLHLNIKYFLGNWKKLDLAWGGCCSTFASTWRCCRGEVTLINRLGSDGQCLRCGQARRHPCAKDRRLAIEQQLFC